jgi:hypothetical protein
VEVRVDGEVIVPDQVALDGDSLFVSLRQRVAGDSLEVSFTSRVLRNATVFSLHLGDGQRPGLWQSVEVAERRANVVHLPAIVGSDRLIGDLEIAPAAFTPNGDGINDVVQIRFVVFKVETVARVRIFDLAGREVAELVGAVGETVTYEWTGGDIQGQMAPPGIYLCHIDLGASSGQGVVVRPVALVY